MAKGDRDVFEMAEDYERKNPGIVEALRLLGISMEKYEASLSALYTPTIMTGGSTEDLNSPME